MRPRTLLWLFRPVAKHAPSQLSRRGIGFRVGLAVIAAVVSPVRSQENGTKEASLRPSYYTCIKASNGVTSALNDCIGAEHDFQDKRLNTAYRLLGKTLPRGERNALRDEERAWIAQRDKSCAPDIDGGTANLLDANQCQLDETAARASALEARLSQ